ncbi:TetR/AcrR family transcriptional regulator [Actinomycetospora atypica]|uniref:TetR/AcrR family transcriptional regulator n=1 Tax=Actinomycetospora atypica TaxID=1290095 RepID=A0ABV9YR14_9PSEU
MPTRALHGTSAEDRVADRRQRLVEAALDVVGERGVADFTMTAVCRAAGLTERYFYENFARREDLLVALFDRSAAASLADAAAAADAAPHDLERRTRAAIAAITDTLVADPRAARLYREAVGHRELAGRRRDTSAAFAELLARLVVDAYPDLPRDDLLLTTTVLTAGVVEAVGSWLDGRLDTDLDRLLTRCARLVAAAVDQLRTDAIPSPEAP